MIDWWSALSLAMGSFLDQHGLEAAFVFLLIEEAGVPVPVPGDVLMLILGVHASQGRVTLWQAILVMELATVLGSTFLYVATRIAGRSLVYRYGRYIRLTPERLDRAEQWLKRHGSRAVFLGRLVPGLRIVTAVACGVFAVPARVFVPAMSVGALLYISVYTLLGYYLGQPVLDLLEQVHLPFGLFGSLIPLGLLVWWTLRARQDLARRPVPGGGSEREQRVRAGAIAGGLGTIGSTLTLNVLINLAGNIAFTAPDTILERTAARLAFGAARGAQPGWIFVAVPVFLGVGVLWGVVYATWGERLLLLDRLSDWQKGILFAMLPFLTSLVFAMPLIGLGFFGVGATGPVAAVGELVRHMTYGVLLGLIYPVLRYRRHVRVLPHTTGELTADQPMTA